jgi:uncharacterized SAM-binding protein YcdF (DUF218 family)
MPAPHLRHDPLLLRDARHSLAVASLAVLLSGGLLYAVFLLRVWRTAARAGTDDPATACVLVFGKRLVDGEPDGEFQRRLQRTLALSSRHPRPVVLLGGGSDARTEAAAGRDALQALGLPDGVAVQLEDRSLDTLQNLRNARDLLGEGATRPLLLVSNRYHLARCQSLARSLGLDGRVCAAEARFCWREQGLSRLITEAAYLCWIEVGIVWARLIGHQRMLERVR